MSKIKTAVVAVALIILVAVLIWLTRSCRAGHQDEEAVPTDTVGQLVMQAKKCSRLYTAEYKVHKIVTHSDDIRLEGSLLKHDFSIKLPVGQRKVAIPIDATVKAYIDMSLLTADDVTRNGDKIEIRLPNPEVVITSTSIDHDGIKRHVALFRHDFSDEELSAYEKLGRHAIEASLKDMDIRETARHGAAQVLIPMIERMGFKESDITLSFPDDEPQPLLNGDIELRVKN